MYNIFLLFSFFLFSNTFTSEHHDDLNYILYYDHNNDNLKPLGIKNGTPVDITYADRLKISRLYSTNYKMDVGSKNGSIHFCLRAYPSCNNLIDCLKIEYQDHKAKDAIIEYLEKRKQLEEQLWFWQIKRFTQESTQIVHKSLINNKVDANNTEETKIMTGEPEFYFVSYYISFLIIFVSFSITIFL